MITKIFRLITKHKIVSLIVVVAIICAGYYGYNKFYGAKVKVSYVTSAVVRGTLSTSVTGSGQISASSQVDLKPKVSGEITKVAVVNGQQVKKGNVIAQIDAADAYKTVRDALANLQSAQLSMDKLKRAATNDEILQAENSLASAQTTLDKLKLSQPTDYQTAQNNLQTAQNNLDKAYNDAFTAISNSFINLPGIITSLDDILYSEEISASEVSIGKGQLNTSALLNSTYETDKSRIMSYQAGAETDYATARKSYDATYQNFKNASVYSDPATIESLLADTLSTSKAISQAIKSENNYINVWSDARTLRNWSVFSQVTTYKTNLTAYASQANTASSNLLAAQTTIKTYKDAITTANNSLTALKQNQPLDLAAAQNSVKEKQNSLATLKAGTDEFDLKAQELALQQKRNSLYDAQQTLADYTIKAPFDGMVAAVDQKVGDSASSATILATVITPQSIAEISLNEVDAAKIKAGQKVTLTFDAVDGLTISGEVAQVDAIGTVSSGVVTYAVKIVFDTQDERIKSGMSTNATIITDVKTDALYVENSAVKTDSNGGNYVQILDASGQPQSRTILIGIADDTNTEITSGLNEGDEVITQTVNSSSSKTTTTTTQRSGNVGGFIMGGGR